MLSSPQCDLCGRTEKYMAEFDPDYTAKFYGAYGDIEWERLEATRMVSSGDNAHRFH